MENKYLGIDLGTSAVKLLLVTPDGKTERVRCAYGRRDPSGWRGALKDAVALLGSRDELSGLGGIALSSQVGTYITDRGDILDWQSPAGSGQLAQVRGGVSDREWLRHIGMVHPELASYPIPRLMYIQQHFPDCRAVEMPKEMLLRELTGESVSDIFSWRGLCHCGSRAYSRALLDRFGIGLELPPLRLPTETAGRVTASAAEKYGLPAGTMVYVGCNDFFAGLLGMGIWDVGSAFELSGTSGHLGMITDGPVSGAFVSGPYFNGCATYGGTKSGGAACDFASRCFGIENVGADQAFGKSPVFLPYLNGERAPVYDDSARGVFFGINGGTDSRELAYAVLEGVVFSLYQIGQGLPLEGCAGLVMGGGPSVNPVMARLKAALFNCPVLRIREPDASALGAAVIAMTGSGEFSSLDAAAKALAVCDTAAMPDPVLRARLLERYEIYRSLYGRLKEPFAEFAKL